MSRLKRILNPETKQQQQLRVNLPPDEALGACREAIRDLGWAPVEDPPGSGRLKGYEDFTKLNCGTSPVLLEMELVEDPDGGTLVALEGTVPGVGGRSQHHLGNGVRAFALALARRNQA